MRRQILRPVANQQLVAVDERLHAADVDERRQNHDLDGRELRRGQAESDLLDERDRLEMIEIHLPVAGDQRLAMRHAALTRMDIPLRTSAPRSGAIEHGNPGQRLAL